MPEGEGSFDPYDLDEIISLLPDRCRGCAHARFIIGLAWKFEASTGTLFLSISDIRERCTGYEGEPAETIFRIIDTQYGSALIFTSVEDPNCPYQRLTKTD